MSCPNSFEVSSSGRTPCRGPARFLQPLGVRRFRIATPGLAAVLASRRPRSSRDEAPEPHCPAPTPGRVIEYEGVQHYVEAAGPPPRRIVEMVAEDRHCGARLLLTGPPPSPEKAIASVAGVVTCGPSTIPSRLHWPAPSSLARAVRIIPSLRGPLGANSLRRRRTPDPPPRLDDGEHECDGERNR